MEPGNAALQRALSAGAQLPGVALGTAFGLATGDPAGVIFGAVAGSVLSSVGSEVVARTLSPRQEKRVGAVLLSAASAITARQTMGQKVRDDGFFEGERSNGTEFVEGVLLTAMNSFEERKVPHLGNLIANVSFESGIDAAAAHASLRLAEALSWSNYCLLAIFAQRDDYPMPETPLGEPSSWPEWAIRQSFQSLTTEQWGLMHYRSTTVGQMELPSFDLNLNGVVMADSGILLSDLLQLADIPRTDLEPLYRDFLALAPSPGLQ